MHCKSCVRGRFGKVSSGREFYNLKKSRVPQEGWNEENFRTQNGVELLLDLVRARRLAVAKGMRSMASVLRAYMIRQVREVCDLVDRRRDSLAYKAEGVITIHPERHAELWAQAIDEVMLETGEELVVLVTPSITSVAMEMHRRNALLLGYNWADADNHVLLERVRVQAHMITRINETTRFMFQRSIQQGIDSGSTVAEVISKVRKEMPGRMWGRIPTIVRTEMGNAADNGTKIALKESEMVAYVSVFGCEAVEPNSPTYKGIPTCNIQNVPISDIDELVFHPNHTGTIIPSVFRNYDGSVGNVPTTEGRPGDFIEGDPEFPGGEDRPLGGN